MSSHSPLKRTSRRSGSGSRTFVACSWKVRALASICLGLEHRPRGRAPARVTHPRGVVADDQHDDVAEILELAELLEHDREAEVDVGRGRVDPELHAQWPAERQLALEAALGQAVDGVTGQPGRRLGRAVPAPPPSDLSPGNLVSVPARTSESIRPNASGPRRDVSHVPARPTRLSAPGGNRCPMPSGSRGSARKWPPRVPLGAAGDRLFNRMSDDVQHPMQGDDPLRADPVSPPTAPVAALARRAPAQAAASQDPAAADPHRTRARSRSSRRCSE